MKLKFLTLILSIAAFANCSGTDDAANIDETQQGLFYWDQTSCADPWGTGENDSNSATASALKNYLIKENVVVANIDFVDISKEGEIPCNSCGCTTGLRILVNIQEKDSSKIEKLGFIKLEKTIDQTN